MAVLHLRGRYEITLLFEDDRVGLEGIDRFGKISFGTVIIPFMALKKNIKSRYSCQYETGNRFIDISLSILYT